MTVQEIHKEVFEDVKNLQSKLNECYKDFKNVVLNADHYPVAKTYDCKTSKKMNFFIVDFTALKRSDWKKPILSFYGIYSRQEGKYAVALSIDMNIVSIYPPLFFERFRERIIKNKSVLQEETIRLYFKNNWGFMGAVVNKDYESVYHCFEESTENEKVSFVAASSQGYCFGEKHGNVNIIKTIISDDMFFDKQKFIFNDLKIAFAQANKNRYGTNIIEI